ncbi:glutamate racemase [Methylobacterium sp. NPDC080182]|uniref:glutamate racemase n=1 Tax=Methylobacterium sp. NPDC080182 TaxID=3390590 RepID=UPI003D037E5F
MSIGVFDSGSGGLTVMRALDVALPDRSFLYLGDHGHAPYGDRSPEEIYALTLRSLERLFCEGCTLCIIACNTAAAWSLRRLQREWLPLTYPDRRVLGVIVPIVEEVTGIHWSADQVQLERQAGVPDVRVAVFATHQCVESHAFAGEIHKRAPHVEVFEEACPRLVPLIERDAPQHELAAAVEFYVRRLTDQIAGKEPDACILGCTHYPLVEALFRNALPQSTRILSQPAVTAESLVSYLRRHHEFPLGERPVRRFLTTGDPELTSRIASRFYGRPIRFEPANLI